MIVAALALASLGLADTEVTLARVMTVGEKQEYAVKSHLAVEARQQGIRTFVPSELDLLYNFTLDIKVGKADGIVEARYLRPTMTQIDGETGDSAPRKRVEKVNLDLSLTVSPVNDILGVKDLTKKDPKKTTGGGDFKFNLPLTENEPDLMQDFGEYVQEFYRLALFAGSFDSSLDFAPKLPLDAVKPGDTWKRTVGYTPQKLSGKEGKSAVQRMDYTYTYVGLADLNGKKVQHVSASLEVSTDLAEYYHQLFDAKPEQTGLKEMPLFFTGTVNFYLDQKTCNVVMAKAKSQGGFKVVATAFPTEPLREEKFQGETTMTRIK
ncbi:MAG TPA: hypothetical protein PKA27_08935 [Fimbriimonadaceae bacterium]|nr:hypothetical protein [Fimbriimonadaceae bacterium]